ncbi:MAG: VanZ family protein [Bacteroidetes bacterium]|nr:VanZ family protein [Bacteroidota bacterium]
MVDTSKTRFFQYNWPGISWALLILILSTITPPSIEIPNLFDLLAPDKIAHFIFYAVFVILFTYGFSRRPSGNRWSRNQFSIPFIGGILYGGLIELYQGYFLTNRTADYVDFIANCIGSIIGWRLMRYLSKREYLTK